jgi:hypothetical protein
MRGRTARDGQGRKERGRRRVVGEGEGCYGGRKCGRRKGRGQGRNERGEGNRSLKGGGGEWQERGRGDMEEGKGERNKEMGEV